MASKAVEERVSAAQEILKELISIKDGVVVVAEGAEDKLLAPVLEKHNITKEAFNVAQTYAQEVSSAFNIEAARAAANEFKSNKDLNEVTGGFKLLDAEINVSVERSHEFRNPQDASKPIVKNLYTQGSAIVKGGLGKGSLGKQINAIWEGLNS